MTAETLWSATSFTSGHRPNVARVAVGAQRVSFDRRPAALCDAAAFTKSYGPAPPDAGITDGTAYLVQGGMVGVVGWEFGLTTESWLDQSIRSWRVQAFAVPAFAVDRPFACKKLTGLASS